MPAASREPRQAGNREHPQNDRPALRPREANWITIGAAHRGQRTSLSIQPPTSNSDISEAIRKGRTSQGLGACAVDAETVVSDACVAGLKCTAPLLIAGLVEGDLAEGSKQVTCEQTDVVWCVLDAVPSTTLLRAEVPGTGSPGAVTLQSRHRGFEIEAR